MSRERESRKDRRVAVLLALSLFLVVLVLLVVTTTARGEDPPGTWHGRTAEEWGLYAEDLETELGEARAELATQARRGRRLHHALRAIRASLRERVRMPGSSGEVRALLCIHRFEGAWSDPGAPYFGGLQMDRDFQRAYGRTYYRELGTAERWPPFVQVAVGLTAVLDGRGFGPWPVSRRRCGV